MGWQRVRHGWVSMHAQIGTTHSSLHIVAQVTDTPGSFPTDLILVFCLFPCPLPAPTPQVLLPKEISPVSLLVGFPCGSAGKQSACNAGDLGSIPELGRSPGEGKGYPLQYSGLENLMDRGAWGATVHRVAKSQTWLKRLSTHLKINCLSSSNKLFSHLFISMWIYIHCIILVKIKYSSNMNMHVSDFSQVWLIETPWTVAQQAPLSKGLSRQEYWSGLPRPFLWDDMPFSLAQGSNPHVFVSWIGRGILYQ